MGKINLGRVVLGGVVAGIVLDLLGYLVDGVLLAQAWNNGMKALGHADLSMNQIMQFNLLGLATGIGMIWVYAAIRPRFGAGVKTAVYAGVAVWVVGILIPNAGLMCVTRLFSHHLTAMTTAGALVEAVVAAIAGAALYTE